MRIEEIVLRQEARQILCEAGFDKESLKKIVLKDIDDKITQAIEKRTRGIEFEDMIMHRVDVALNKAVEEIVKRQVNNFFYNKPLKIHATASFEE